MPGGLSVFVGDSASDLLAMLRCDIGIVLASKPTGSGLSTSFERVARAGGVKLQPISALPELRATPAEPTVFVARSWEEVARVLFRGVDPTIPGFEASAIQSPRVLAIAGSDSGGGAGIQADLKACSALGAFGMSAVTALTAQNTRGVQAVEDCSPAVLRQQIDSVLTDIGADCIKTGMLPNETAVSLVAEALVEHRTCWRHLVVDPVMVATSGDSLAGAGVGGALIRQLFPLATLVTPNIPEAMVRQQRHSLHASAWAASRAFICRAVLRAVGACIAGPRGSVG